MLADQPDPFPEISTHPARRESREARGGDERETGANVPKEGLGREPRRGYSQRRRESRRMPERRRAAHGSWPEAPRTRKVLAIGDKGSARSPGSVFTIGHSNHSSEKLVGLLKRHGIEVLVDSRSRPYSRYAPHFNARALEGILSAVGIGYLFLGKGLGGRPEREDFYDANGRVDYVLVERSQPFLDGISRLEKEIQTLTVALLCSEENPAGCHRRLLVGRALGERGFVVRHIRGDGRVQTEGEESGVQPVLFTEAEVSPRKSIRSVSRKRRRPSSSGR